MKEEGTKTHYIGIQSIWTPQHRTEVEVHKEEFQDEDSDTDSHTEEVTTDRDTLNPDIVSIVTEPSLVDTIDNLVTFDSVLPQPDRDQLPNDNMTSSFTHSRPFADYSRTSDDECPRPPDDRRTDTPVTPEKEPEIQQTEYQSNITSTLNTAHSSAGTSKQTTDSACKLTVNDQSKVERELGRKAAYKCEPPKVVVVFKWIATIVLGLLGLICLVGSRLSFVAVAVRLNIAQDGETTISCYAFTMVTLILLIPNVFNLLRSLCMGATRKDMPWPSKGSLLWIAVATLLESLGVCLFAFKILNLQFGVTGLLTTNVVLIGPIGYLIYRRWECGHPRAITVTCTIALFLLMSSVGIAGWRGYTVVSQVTTDVWHLPVAILCLTVTWIPSIQKRLISTSGTFNKTQSVTVDSHGDMCDIERGRFQPSDENLVDVLENTPDENANIQTESFWKSAILMSAFRIPAIIGFSVILFFVDSDQSVSMDSFEKSWSDFTVDDIAFRMFLANICCTLLGYFISLAACRIAMQRGAFVIPLLLSTPVVAAIVTATCTSTYYNGIDDGEMRYPDICDSGEMVYTAVATAVVVAAMGLSFGWVIWQTDTIVMCLESHVFWSPAYPGILLNEWLFAIRRNIVTEEREAPKSTARKTKVYICTTMYRETRDEMKQLLESICRVKEAQCHSDKYFESHVFFDGGVKDRTPTDFALQLISLLPETLGVQTMICTRSMTAYGMKLSWHLSSSKMMRQAREMTFTIHLKDNRKVKNKKRWSQIMYMSYVLDFLVKQYIDAEGNSEVDDTNAFILTTDADVNFTPDSVEALLDLMTRDSTVGAVCARTHPIGFGPLVWYQKFEYAIGHWFQKAAEDVLGSVLCAPGCFSVYRVSAVRDIVSTYSSNVEKAFEFLTKDMGEDRWFCTLLVQSGWRIEYCATAENKTQCPEEFDEFYKQRRRWIASTIANLLLLVREWKVINRFNHRVSFLFTTYQALLLFSTLIGPSVVILVVSGGLVYAWNVDSVTTILLQCLTCIVFAVICLNFSQTTQMKAAKLLTFMYACVMMAVAVGTAQQVVSDLSTGKPGVLPVNNTVAAPTLDPSDISIDLPVSLTTIYLGSLIGIFFIAGLLHPLEIVCLVHGFWYLLCLPSGYLILNIYSVCNITDRSWGTREEKEHSMVKNVKPWYESLGEKMQVIFYCCYKPPHKPDNNTSVTETGPKQHGIVRDLSKSISEEPTDHPDIGGVHRGARLLSAEEMEYDDDYFEDEDKPMAVEEWLDKDFRAEYAPRFKKHGFDSTLFISGMTEKDLASIGIRQKAHKTFLMERIRELPEFRIEVKVPEDVKEWLHEIGLDMYRDMFKANKITAAKDLEVLKSFSRKEIESELKITKSGHVVRLLTAIKHLRNPTDEELQRISVKKDLSYTDCYELELVNKEESVFWRELTAACLKPGSVVFGHNEELKVKLEELRNNFLGILAVANTLWLILLSTLASKMELKVYGTDPIGLIFLGIFGFLFLLQFLCMLIHRMTTLGHFCARAPYRFGQEYNSSWKFADGSLGLSINEEDKQALQYAREGNKKIKARLRYRGRNNVKHRVYIEGEKVPLLPNASHQHQTYI